MKRSNFFRLSVLCVCLLIGLSAPFLSTLIQDRHTDSHHTFADGAHYIYRGTLLNRVLALNAHLNNSPALEEISRSEGSCSDALALWTELCAFLPISGEYELSCEYITLAPKQYNAQYRYISLTYVGQDAVLYALIDAESNLPLRIELHCAPDVLHAFWDGRSSSDPICDYTRLLGLAEPADLYYSRSAVLWGYSAPLRGVPYTAEMTTLPSGGMLLFKLTAVSE